MTARLSRAPMLGLLAGIAALGLCSKVALAGVIEVPLDQVRIVTFKTPVKTVFVGNPVIADVTVIDATRVFVLGKNFGTTNIVALDARGREAANEEITVRDRAGSLVTVQRGLQRTTLTCIAARCEATPLPGDGKEPYDAITDQIGKREELNLKAAGQ